MIDPAPAPDVPALAVPPRLTLRRCFLLCLPALILGLVLRILFMISIPEGYSGSDSNSYFDTASSLFIKHKWEMGDKRAGVYPLLLIPATALPGSTVIWVAAAQHAVGLGALLALGWIVGNFTRRPVFWVPLVTLLYACVPSALWFEHEVMADSLQVNFFLFAVALALPLVEVKRPQRLFWFLICAMILVALKPHGKPLWFGLIVAAVCIRPDVLRWGIRNYVAVALGLFLTVGAGSSKQGSWLLLSSTLPLVPTEGEKFPEHRAALAPVIKEAGQNLFQYPWKQGYYKKIINDSDQPEWQGGPWASLLKDSKLFSKVAKRFSVEAVTHHPVDFTRFVLMKLAIAMAKVAPDPKFNPAAFWRMQEGHNKERWRKRPAQAELLYGKKEPEYQAMVQERLKRPVYLKEEHFKMMNAFNWFVQAPPEGRTTLVVAAPLNNKEQKAKVTAAAATEDAEALEEAKVKALGVTWPPAFNRLVPTWYFYLGCLGIIHCLLPRHLRRASLILIPTFCYMVMVYTVGDSRPRYLMPVEWVGLLLGALGVELLLDLAIGALQRRKTGDALPIPATPEAAMQKA